MRPPDSSSAACCASRERVATASCSGEVQKTAERYCEPTSKPWRLRVVGSWQAQKRSSSSSYGVLRIERSRETRALRAMVAAHPDDAGLDRMLAARVLADAELAREGVRRRSS